MQRLPIRLPKRSKLGNIKTFTDGIDFDSKKEARRYRELKMLQRAGQIANLELQHPFTLQEGFRDMHGVWHRSIVYIADFIYFEYNYPDALIVEDVKGFRTDIYRLKQKLLLFKFPNIIFKET